MTEMDPRLRDRLLYLAAVARDALAPDERVARLRWCADHGNDALTFRRDGGDLVGTWGGAELVRVDEELLRAMSTADELTAYLTAPPDVPDDARELTQS